MLVKLESDIYVISFTVSSWEIEPSISRKYDMTICLNQTLFYRSNQIFFYRRHFINYCAILITDTNPNCWQFYRWVYWTIYINTVCGGRDCITIFRLFLHSFQSLVRNVQKFVCCRIKWFDFLWEILIFFGPFSRMKEMLYLYTNYMYTNKIINIVTQSIQ